MRLTFLLLFFVVACGGGSGADAGTDAAPDARRACTTDHDCDDGIYCNGTATCAAGVGCVAGAPPCRTGQVCSEVEQSCTTDCAVVADADGDGHMAPACGGDDCDDADATRYPGNHEICDSVQHDDDCDATTFGFRDEDGDGYPDVTCCNVAGDGAMHCGTDCDDANANAHPAQAEVCNHVDDDCNGMVDDGITVTWTIDGDVDGHGDATPGAATVIGCTAPAGYASSADDCDDANAGVHPGVPETCDAIDDDCNGMTDEVVGGCDCTGTGTRDCGLPGRCAGASQMCVSGHWSTCSIVPVMETCNTIDDDCNGVVDDGLTATCYQDTDDDGYAPLAAPSSTQCRSSAPGRAAAPFNGCPTGYTGRRPMGSGNVDCCDGDAHAFPGTGTPYTTASACGGFDFNCDGAETSQPTYGQVENCAMFPTSGSCSIDLYGAGNGWQGSVPACGGAGTFRIGCTWSGSCHPRDTFAITRSCY